MSQYHPPQRQIKAHIHTTAGWIHAMFHMPLLHGFVDFLNQEHSVVKLTDAWMPGSSTALEFAAVRKASILTVIPDAPEEELQLATPTRATEQHTVSCLLDTGLVVGVLDIPAQTRVSDYLLHHDGFFPLRNCTVYAERGAPHRSAPLAVINAEHVVAVSEREGL